MWVFCQPVRVIFISYLLLMKILLYFFIGQNSNTLFISQEKKFYKFYNFICPLRTGPRHMDTVIYSPYSLILIYSFFFKNFSFFSLFFYTYPPLHSLFISNISYHFFLFLSHFFFLFFIFLYT